MAKDKNQVNLESPSYILLIALSISLVCSIIVSTFAVALKDRQDKNELLDKYKNVLEVAGVSIGDRDIESMFSQEFEPHIVNINSGDIVNDYNQEGFDQLRVAKDLENSRALNKEEDIATLLRRENFAIVYIKKDANGHLDKLILPVRGYGLWGTLYGFLALENDLETVAGLTFYQHKETPGLGGEVDNKKWKDLWPGKSIYDADGKPAIRLVKSKKDDRYDVDALAGATLTSRGVENLVHFWVGDLGYGKFLEKYRNSRGEL